MIQKDKELLLKDLCARLPYKVMIQSVGENKCLGLMDLVDIDLLPKPYLRPMSSMTEEEKEEAKENGCIIYWDTSPEDKGLMVIASQKGFDWLNEHHFDYRGLIKRGLAIEAPEGMYDIKEQKL